MTKDEALKLALEALECWQRNEDCNEPMSKILEAIKEALAQPERLAELGWQEIDCPICGGGARVFPKPEQEPVGPEPFGFFQYDIRLDAWVQNRINNKGVAFYTKEKK